MDHTDKELAEAVRWVSLNAHRLTWERLDDGTQCWDLEAKIYAGGRSLPEAVQRMKDKLDMVEVL